MRIPIVVSTVMMLAASTLAAQDSGASQAPTRRACGTGVPPSEMHRFVPLPSGDVFCSLIADPKELGSFVSYLHATSATLNTDLASVGIGDRFGLVRWGGAGPNDGVQISLAGSVFAQFDAKTSSTDLINADYLIAVPITIRRDWFSTRIRFYHQSSHLGDEFLLRSDHPERENLSYESAEVLVSADAGVLRVYGGGEYLVRVDPSTLERTLMHAGAELRQGGTFINAGRLGSANLIASLDVKSSEEQRWRPAYSARAGLEVGRAKESGGAGRRWRLLGEYYRGPSPYGQFFLDRMEYYGIGMHFTL